MKGNENAILLVNMINDNVKIIINLTGVYCLLRLFIKNNMRTEPNITANGYPGDPKGNQWPSPKNKMSFSLSLIRLNK